MTVMEGGAGFDPSKTTSSTVPGGFSIQTGSYDGPDNRMCMFSSCLRFMESANSESYFVWHLLTIADSTCFLWPRSSKSKVTR